MTIIWGEDEVQVHQPHWVNPFDAEYAVGNLPPRWPLPIQWKEFK